MKAIPGRDGRAPKRPAPADGTRASRPVAHARGNASDAVAELLRREIVGGALKPGTRLIAADLAAQYSVSRTPVRDAFHTLAAEGLVSLTAGVGAVVSTMTPEDVVRLYGLREHLEGLAARLAAQRSSMWCLREFAVLLPKIDDAAQAGRFDDLSTLNFEFHAIVREAAHNVYLDRALRQCQDAAKRFPQRTLERPGRALESVVEHGAIADAISRGNADLAEHLALDHMHKLSELRIESLLRNRAARPNAADDDQPPADVIPTEAPTKATARSGGSPAASDC